MQPFLFFFSDDEKILRILENDLILKHDCIWPHGLNFSLHVDSLLEVSEFRKSCIRHNWPPDGDALDSLEIDVEKLRNQIQNMPSMEIPVADAAPIRKKTTKLPKEEPRPEWSDDFRLDRKPRPEKEKEERPSSPASVTSENAEMTSSTTSSSSDTQKHQTTVSTPKKKPTQSKPVSVVKKSAAKKAPGSPRKELAKAKVVQKSSSNQSVGSDKSAEEQPVESATRTVTPVLKEDNRPIISQPKVKNPANQKSPVVLRKEATRIIKKAEPEEKPEKKEEEENVEPEGEEKIDSSTRPVTPTLEQDPVIDEANLVSQVSEALEGVQIEDVQNGEEEDAVDGVGEYVSEEPMKRISKSKLSSQGKIPKAVVKTKKVLK